ncbi:hypothetical protein PSTG_16982, partial [Puccinia striiformis f. sp. tritici PST-78]
MINVEDEEPSEWSTLGNEQIEGQKAAKKKRTDGESMGKIIHMQKELVQISRERLDTMKSAVQEAADEIILSKDLDSMDGQKHAYYERKLKLIYNQEDAKEEEEKKRMEREKAKEDEKEKDKERVKAKAKEGEEAKAEEKVHAKAKADAKKKKNSAYVDVEGEV